MQKQFQLVFYCIDICQLARQINIKRTHEQEGEIGIVQTCSQGPKCPCNDSDSMAYKGQASYTCAEQKEFSKCGEAFLSRYCDCVCGVCEYAGEEMMMGGEMMMAPTVRAPKLSKKEIRAANKAATIAREAARKQRPQIYIYIRPLTLFQDVWPHIFSLEVLGILAPHY
eukprot:TRINITY_DN1027_c0_g1_i10.p5 TRINITY_DN1027_c0_g1~~TRINITY_DN1027_c0_g1_i10.p5  ORF type:complete len:169 (+),score=17.54 TRINITY_DN1027_c0_g1_i10:70-576(+)